MEFYRLAFHKRAFALGNSYIYYISRSYPSDKYYFFLMMAKTLPSEAIRSMRRLVMTLFFIFLDMSAKLRKKRGNDIF
jgi:hypothetical protein